MRVNKNGVLFTASVVVPFSHRAANCFSRYNFLGRLAIEISFIVVIYAGFRLDLAKGALLAFVFGFVLDCMTSPVIGLFTVIYILVFLCSFILSFILDIEKIHFIALFGFLCALIKEIFVIIFYNLVLNFDTVMNIPFICLPQAIIIGLLTPFILLFNATARGIFLWKTVSPY